MQALRVTALQADLQWENPQANRQRLAAMNIPATDLILLPEMFTTGFTMNAAALAEETEGPTLEWMEELASKHQALVCGSIIVEEDGEFFNRCLIVDPSEGLIAEYDKRHLFRLAGEDRTYTQGEAWVWVQYKDWKIVPMICYDLRFPVWSRNRLRDDEDRMACDLLLYMANWPTPRIHHWDALLMARAIENQCFVAASNRVGTDGKGLSYPGHSRIITPWGDILSELKDAEGVISAELQGKELKEYRDKFPFWLDSDEFELAL
ncbi:MAG: amidohydrolase [Bacteroidetes bacterium]|nr:MAG: amidohydrolase [Bacteroidota bacterium]